MSSSRILLLSELFDHAVDLSQTGCEAFIADRCAGDVKLESELRRLLMRHRALEGKRTQSPLDWAAQQFDSAEPPTLVEGQVVGVYRVDAEIGHGGMGRVFRATRSDGAFAQDVAIKVMRRDRMNPALLKRFSTEQSVLAALDHPGISRLLDAATLADGTPYVVMELVRGEHVTAYCNSRRLSTRQRVALFRKVLDAVGHAHRNLIVHRDIKDSNVLVTEEGQPKLLDFGIAKPLSDIEHGNTATADRFFTPSHAAPEQLRGEPVTAGYDVYASGILLYELLSGSVPFDFEGLSAGEMERLIVAVPPPAMSGKVDPTAAPAHGTLDPRSWRTELSGDLEAIVQRALRKEAHERYVTVEQFDADLANYLGNRPVEARGTQGWYRARKFAARNRAAVVLAVFALAALTATGIAIAFQNIALARERDRATAERDRATLERDRAEFAVQFLSDAFTQADPARAGGAEVSARTILEAARKRVAALRSSQPELFASLGESLARVHLALGLAEDAAQLATQVREAAELQRKPTQKLASLYLLEAEALTNSGGFEEAAARLAWLDSIGHGSTPDYKFVKARLFTQQGEQIEAAIDLLEAACIETARRPPTDERANQIRWQLAESLRLAKRAQESLDVLDETLRWQKAGLPKNHPRIALSSIRRVERLRALQRPEEALAQAEQTTPTVIAHYGDKSSLAAIARSSLGNALADRDRTAEAAVAFAGALDSYRQSLGENHPHTIRCEFNLGNTLRKVQGRKREAEAHLRAASLDAARVMGTAAPLSIYFRMIHAEYLLELGRPAEALMELANEGALGGVASAGEIYRQEFLRMLADASGRTGCHGQPPATTALACETALRFLAPP